MCIDKKSPIYNSLQPPICKIVSVFLLKSKIGHYYWQRKLMFSCILLFHSKIVLRNCWHTHFSEQEGNTRHTIKTELPFSQPNRSTPNQVYFILCVATTPQSSASEAIPHERQAKVSSQWSKSPAADRLLLQASLHIWFDIPHWTSRLSKRLWSADNATVFSFRLPPNLIFSWSPLPTMCGASPTYEFSESLLGNLNRSHSSACSTTAVRNPISGMLWRFSWILSLFRCFRHSLC